MAATAMCPGCGNPMDAVGLTARYGRTIAVDVCGGCGGLWFDHAESQQLSPGATLKLLERLTLRPTRPLGARSACPRCRQTLLDVHDRQRATNFSYRRCPSGHGRFITAYHFMREKHLVRELSLPEIEQVRARVQQVNCVNCGAPISLAGTLACGHCATPVSMVDPQQLQRELSTLNAAEARDRELDPTLPIRLMQERAAVERAWAGMPGDRSWVDELMSVQESGIAQAAIRLIGMRLG
jgi:hypothetical protein